MYAHTDKAIVTHKQHNTTASNEKQDDNQYACAWFVMLVSMFVVCVCVVEYVLLLICVLLVFCKSLSLGHVWEVLEGGEVCTSI